MDMDFAVGGPLVRRFRLVFGFCPSTHAFARCFLQTPPRGGSPCTLLALHLHQVGQKTFTSKLLSMPSTPPARCAGARAERLVTGRERTAIARWRNSSLESSSRQPPLGPSWTGVRQRAFFGELRS